MHGINLASAERICVFFIMKQEQNVQLKGCMACLLHVVVVYGLVRMFMCV